MWRSKPPRILHHKRLVVKGTVMLPRRSGGSSLLTRLLTYFFFPPLPIVRLSAFRAIRTALFLHAAKRSPGL